MAQSKLFRLEKDSIPLFRGFAVSVDVAAPAKMILGDYGGYEAALRLNLHDQYFPVFELGYGISDAEDITTGVSYKTKAPYFRIGADVNILKNKHAPYRMYAGARYAFTTYNVDISTSALDDPVWGWPSDYSVKDERCSQHWLEAALGVDATIWGPLHLGWTVRWRFRLSHTDTPIGKAWYVPGFGKQDTSCLDAGFNVIIDI